MKNIKNIYQELERCASDAERVELLAQLSTEFLNTDINRCAEVVEQIGEIAKQNNDAKTFGYYHSGLGRIHFKNSQFADALKAFTTAIDYARKANAPMLESNCYHSLGMVYWKEGLFEQSLEVSLKALDFFKELDDPTGNQALCYNNVGNIYERMGEFDKAEEAYEQGMKILNTIGEERMNYNVKGNLGVIKLRKKQYAEALTYLEPVYKGFIKLKHATGEILTLVHIGHAKVGMRQFPKAMEYYLLALKKLKVNDFKFAEAEAHRGLGNIYMAIEGQGLEEALKHYEKGMEIVKSIDYQSGICEFYIDFSNVYQAMGKFDLALEAVEEGLKLANQKKLPLEKRRLEYTKEQLLNLKAKVA